MKTIENKPVDQLTFDPENPRLPSTLDKRDERKVLEWMLRDATITELMGSIGETGYFPAEPMLVVGPNRKNLYEVVEGNRRLCAIKLLLHPDLAPVRKRSVQTISAEAKHHPSEVPVITYRDRREILDYLGYRHITGIKEWDPLAKARYVEQLWQNMSHIKASDRFQAIAKTIGSRADYVARLLTGLNVYEKIAQEDFFDIKNLTEESIDFSVLTTALNYNSIVEFTGMESASDPSLKGLKKKNLKYLTSWLFEVQSDGKTTRLGESRNLKLLSAVVSSPKALSSLITGAPLKEAFLQAQEPTDIFRTSINTAKTQLHTAREYSHLADKASEADASTLGEINKLSRDLKSILDNRLKGEEEA